MSWTMGLTFLNLIIRNLLKDHVELKQGKAVSYLPINTVERVIGVSASEYVGMIERAGNKGIVFYPDRCCIKSGAVYAYDAVRLKYILKENEKILRRFGWPINPENFLERIASEWIGDEDPVLKVIKQAFGDS